MWQDPIIIAFLESLHPNDIFYIFTWYHEVLTHCEHLWITISLWVRCGESSDQFDFDRSTVEKQLFLALHKLLAHQAISTSSGQNTKNIRLILPLPPAEISHYEKSRKSSLSGKDMDVFRLWNKKKNQHNFCFFGFGVGGCRGCSLKMPDYDALCKVSALAT